MQILNYHLIGPEDDPMCVPLDRFEEQVEALAGGGVTLLREEDVLAGLEAGQAPDGVLVTFDDGYRNTIEVGLPVLERHGVPALVAVCSAYLDPDHCPRRTPHLSGDFMDPDDVHRWRATGRDVAAHSFSHMRLPGLSDAMLAWQVDVDHELLTALLGAPPATFVYPYGAHDGPVEEAVGRRYRLGLATNNGRVVDLSRPLAVPRLCVRPGWSPDELLDALASGRAI